MGSHLNNPAAVRRIALFWRVAACGALLNLSCNADAQTYPVQTVRYVVGATAGTGVDIIARIVAENMSQSLGRQFIVDNRAGAAGANIAAEAVARSTADGHTLLQAAISHAANVTLYKNLRYDITRDFTPVTLLATSPAVIAIHPSLPARSMREFIRLAKSRPGAINYASAGAGTSTYLAAELFKSAAGIELQHVPYRGGNEALIATSSGESAAYFGPVGAVAPHIQQGRLRGLAVTTARRFALLPDTPTAIESGLSDFEFGNWYGLMAPAKTPSPIVATLESHAIAALKKPAVVQRLNDLGYIILGSTPAEFSAHLKTEITKLAAVIRRTGISAE
jgi:tripartite-type tricarboxylate transporter receptor subunit TctC